MFCKYCGNEVKDGAKFCPSCGKQLTGEARDTIGDTIDNVGEDIGKGIDDAVNEFKDGFKNSSEKFTEAAGNVGQKADDIRKNWKDYLTVENMEKLAALTLLLPLFMSIVNKVLGTMYGNFFYMIPVAGPVFLVGLKLIRLLFVLAALCGVLSMGYILLMVENKRNTWSYILAGATVVAFISCLGYMFYWVPIRFILCLICLVYGIDIFSVIVIQNKGVEATPNVSEDMGAYKAWYEDYKAKNPTTTEVTVEGGPESYFDGSGVELFGYLILTSILSAVTCGLAAPWMICKILKWRKEHTVIDGRRLAFNGTGGSLFGHWILWEILTIITCGIYAFFMYVALRRWEMERTYYEGDLNTLGQFDGNSFQYFGYALLQGILCTITCGLAAPWTITMIEKWEMKHTKVGVDRMKYEGTGLGLLGQYLIVFVLTLITCGIYSAWGTVRLNKYIYSHTHVDAQAL